jgi:beta-lactamase class A
MPIKNSTAVACILLSLAVAGHAQSVAAAQTPQSSLDGLKAELQKIRENFPGNISIYMKNLKTGEEIAIDADSVYETFSVIKIPIMVEVLRESEAGKFKLSDRISLKASDARIPSGVLYTLEPGLQPTIKDLITLMIIISDNVATDLLADKVGRANVTKTMKQLGLEKTEIQFSDLDWDRTWLSSMDPSYKSAHGDQTLKFPFDKFPEERVQEAFGKTIYESNVYFGHSTTREIGKLLEQMVQGKLVSKQASDLMLDTMKKQQVNNRFPKYLKDVTIAHKTGDGQPFIANDAGVLWVKDQPIVLVVFTGHHHGETESLHDAVARVAAYVARHYGAKMTPNFKP